MRENVSIAQALFGDPQAHDVPDFLDDPLHTILSRWLMRHGRDEDTAEWHAAYGTDFPDHPELVVRPYDWGWDDGDEPMRPNLEFGGVRIWWYKYLGRGMTTDVVRSERTWRRWLSKLESFVETAEVTPSSPES